ncbi:MAG: chemotaxis protein [Pseudomonadota bacterium]|nr:chemotaxis protein [Pseudomonadota bacterium]
MGFSADDLSLVEADVANPASGARNTSPGGGGTDQQGAVLVLAGIGGPDAVRQFLAAIPDGFARPVVVRQRLDGGRHDRLVQQMQRATTLPVALAEAGTRLQAGRIYILPDGMTTQPQGDDSVFSATDAPVPVLAGLPAGDSAILLLSGSDPDAVPEAMAAAAQGAIVAGQAVEDCFDSAATAALVAAGGEASAPADFAQRLSTRWLSLSL